MVQETRDDWFLCSAPLTQLRVWCRVHPKTVILTVYYVLFFKRFVVCVFCFHDFITQSCLRWRQCILIGICNVLCFGFAYYDTTSPPLLCRCCFLWKSALNKKLEHVKLFGHSQRLFLKDNRNILTSGVTPICHLCFPARSRFRFGLAVVQPCGNFYHRSDVRYGYHHHGGARARKEKESTSHRVSSE